MLLRLHGNHPYRNVQLRWCRLSSFFRRRRTLPFNPSISAVAVSILNRNNRLKVCEWTRCSDMGRPLRHDYITRLLLCTNFSSDIIKLAFLFVSIKQHVHVSEHHSRPSATLLLDPKIQTDHSADCGEEVADEDGVLSHGNLDTSWRRLCSGRLRQA